MRRNVTAEQATVNLNRLGPQGGILPDPGFDVIGNVSATSRTAHRRQLARRPRQRPDVRQSRLRLPPPRRFALRSALTYAQPATASPRMKVLVW
jgi:hypothetical protein